MFLKPFFSEAGPDIRISRKQGSLFAKDIAGDFNPIHDPDNKRYCVPGDLLFALVLSRYGLCQEMKFHFTGMVGDGAALRFPQNPANSFAIRDAAGKTYLEIERRGDSTCNASRIEQAIRTYVAFSGHNFPHILVPLMERHGVMINTARPFVLYERMSFVLERVEAPELRLELVDSTLEVKGKRGDARLYFQFMSGTETIGRGHKKLVLSGLRDLDAHALQGLVARYAGWKEKHLNGRPATTT